MVKLLLCLSALQNCEQILAQYKELYSVENHLILQWYVLSPEFHFEGVCQQ